MADPKAVEIAQWIRANANRPKDEVIRDAIAIFPDPSHRSSILSAIQAVYHSGESPEDRIRAFVLNKAKLGWSENSQAKWLEARIKAKKESPSVLAAAAKALADLGIDISGTQGPVHFTDISKWLEKQIAAGSSEVEAIKAAQQKWPNHDANILYAVGTLDTDAAEDVPSRMVRALRTLGWDDERSFQELSKLWGQRPMTDDEQAALAGLKASPLPPPIVGGEPAPPLDEFAQKNARALYLERNKGAPTVEALRALTGPASVKAPPPSSLVAPAAPAPSRLPVPSSLPPWLYGMFEDFVGPPRPAPPSIAEKEALRALRASEDLVSLDAPPLPFSSSGGGASSRMPFTVDDVLQSLSRAPLPGPMPPSPSPLLPSAPLMPPAASPDVPLSPWYGALDAPSPVAVPRPPLSAPLPPPPSASIFSRIPKYGTKGKLATFALPLMALAAYLAKQEASRRAPPMIAPSLPSEQIRQSPNLPPSPTPFIRMINPEDY